MSKQLVFVHDRNTEDRIRNSDFVRMMNEQFAGNQIVCAFKFTFNYKNSFVQLFEGYTTKRTKLSINRDSLLQFLNENLREGRELNKRVHTFLDWFFMYVNQATEFNYATDDVFSEENETLVIQKSLWGQITDQMFNYEERRIIIEDSAQSAHFGSLLIVKSEGCMIQLFGECFVIMQQCFGDCAFNSYIGAKRIAMEIERELIVKSVFDKLVIPELEGKLPVTNLRSLPCFDFCFS